MRLVHSDRAFARVLGNLLASSPVAEYWTVLIASCLSPWIHILLPRNLVMRSVLGLLPVPTTPVAMDRTFARVWASGSGLRPRRGLRSVPTPSLGMDRAFVQILVTGSGLGLLGLLRLLLIPHPWDVLLVLLEVLLLLRLPVGVVPVPLVLLLPVPLLGEVALLVHYWGRRPGHGDEGRQRCALLLEHSGVLQVVP